MGSTSVVSVAASGVLVAASGVVCDSPLFSLEIAVTKKLLTADGARTKSSVSLIKQVARVGQQHKAFGLQGRVIDVAHVGQADPCYKSRTAEYLHKLSIELIHDKTVQTAQQLQWSDLHSRTTPHNSPLHHREAMGCLSQVIQRKMTAIHTESTVLDFSDIVQLKETATMEGYRMNFPSGSLYNFIP